MRLFRVSTVELTIEISVQIVLLRYPTIESIMLIEFERDVFMESMLESSSVSWVWIVLFMLVTFVCNIVKLMFTRLSIEWMVVLSIEKSMSSLLLMVSTTESVMLIAFHISLDRFTMFDSDMLILLMIVDSMLPIVELIVVSSTQMVLLM